MVYEEEKGEIKLWEEGGILNVLLCGLFFVFGVARMGLCKFFNLVIEMVGIIVWRGLVWW